MWDGDGRLGRCSKPVLGSLDDGVQPADQWQEREGRVIIDVATLARGGWPGPAACRDPRLSCGGGLAWSLPSPARPHQRSRLPFPYRRALFPVTGYSESKTV